MSVSIHVCSSKKSRMTDHKNPVSGVGPSHRVTGTQEHVHTLDRKANTQTKTTERQNKSTEPLRFHHWTVTSKSGRSQILCWLSTCPNSPSLSSSLSSSKYPGQQCHPLSIYRRITQKLQKSTASECNPTSTSDKCLLTCDPFLQKKEKKTTNVHKMIG